MAALSADGPQLDHRPNSGSDSYEMTTSTTIYAHSFVGVTAGGFCVPWADTANYEFLGIAREGIATGASLGSPPERCKVDTSGPILKNVAVANTTQASVGEYVYCDTDNPADLDTAASTNVGPIGRVINFVSASDCDVEILTPAVHLGT